MSYDVGGGESIASDSRRSTMNEEGRRFVPAHEAVYQNLSSEMQGIFYLHYFHSNVSCIRVRKGMLGAAFKLLAGGSYISHHEAETRFRAILKVAIDNYEEAPVSFDTRRVNDGFKGFYAYLGTSSASLVCDQNKSYRAQQKGAPVDEGFKTSLREKLAESLALLKELSGD